MHSDPVRREQVLAKAVQAGKFPPSRVDHYRAAYEADPAGTEQLIEALTPGLPPDALASVRPALDQPTTDNRSIEAALFANDPERGTGRVWQARDSDPLR